MKVWIVEEEEQYGSCSCQSKSYIQRVFDSEEKVKQWIAEQIKYWTERGVTRRERHYDISQYEVW